jgi:ketosteroid isomerase-like protein
MNPHERLATEMMTAINDRDYSQIERLSTEEIQLRLPPMQVFSGRDGIAEFFHHLEEVLPQLTLVAREIHSGDGFAVVEWDSKGTSSQEKPIESMGALVLRFDGDQIKRATLYLDTAQWQTLNQN